MGVLKKAIENYLKERSKSQLIPNYCLTISLSREGMGISKQGTSIEELDWNWKFLVDSVLVMIFYMDKSSKFHHCNNFNAIPRQSNFYLYYNIFHLCEGRLRLVKSLETS